MSEKMTASEVAAQLAAHEKFCEQEKKQREKDHLYIKNSLEKITTKTEANETAIAGINVSVATLEATARTTAKFMYVIGSGLFTGVVGILVVLLTRGIG